jgi:signal transduction histidine kinase
MKIKPSIFLCIILFFFCCDADVTKENSVLTSSKVEAYISKSNDEQASLSNRKEALDSAVYTAKLLQNDSLLLKSLSHKALFYATNYPEQSYKHIEELNQEAFRLNKPKHQAYSNLLFGNYFFNISERDSAYNYFKNSNYLLIEHPDSLRIAYNLVMMSRIHQFYNDYSASEELAVEALKYLENSQHKDYIIEAFNILGHTYIQNKDYNQAINYYQKSLDFVEDNHEKIILQNNIASAHILLDKPDIALQKLSTLLHQNSVNSYPLEKALILYNIGSAKFKKDNSDGLQELQQSLKIRDSIHHVLGQIGSHLKLGEYFENKNKQKAQEHLIKALDISTRYNNVDNRLKALKILIRLADNNAISKYSKTYIQLNDSITNVRQKAKNQFAKYRFDHTKEQQKNLLLKSQNAEDELLIQKQKNQNQGLLFGILILFGFGILFYLVIKAKHKKEKIKEAYLTENRIAVKIHDELANDIYNTIAYTENTDLSQEQNKSKLLDNLEDVYHRTRNISKENTTIDTGENYLEFLKNMLSEYQQTDRKILIVAPESIPWSELGSHQKIIVYRVLQELMVNMKKHSQATIVMLRFEIINKKVHIYYSDNGVGLSNVKINLKNGFQNVENRIKTINGTITFEPKSVTGLKILITFPM